MPTLILARTDLSMMNDGGRGVRTDGKGSSQGGKVSRLQDKELMEMSDDENAPAQTQTRLRRLFFFLFPFSLFIYPVFFLYICLIAANNHRITHFRPEIKKKVTK